MDFVEGYLNKRLLLLNPTRFFMEIEVVSFRNF